MRVKRPDHVNGVSKGGLKKCVLYKWGKKLMMKHAPIIYTLHNTILLLAVSLSSRPFAFLVPNPTTLAQMIDTKKSSFTNRSCLLTRFCHVGERDRG
jgi:hypothetical protein